MLTNLRLRNFKVWRDSGSIRLAPLTVLFGTNSAGKTSIPQLLLLLKQTAASPDRQRALQLGDQRTLVDLGTYADMVHGHETREPLGIALARRDRLQNSLPAGPQQIRDDTRQLEAHLFQQAFQLALQPHPVARQLHPPPR